VPELHRCFTEFDVGLRREHDCSAATAPEVCHVGQALAGEAEGARSHHRASGVDRSRRGSGGSAHHPRRCTARARRIRARRRRPGKAGRTGFGGSPAGGQFAPTSVSATRSAFGPGTWNSSSVECSRNSAPLIGLIVQSSRTRHGRGKDGSARSARASAALRAVRVCAQCSGRRRRWLAQRRGCSCAANCLHEAAVRLVCTATARRVTLSLE
jgi:hypothetical protein